MSGPLPVRRAAGCRWMQFTVPALMLALTAGCEQLELPSGSSESESASAPAPEAPAASEAPLNLPPMESTAVDPSTLSGEEFARWFRSLAPNAITDAALERAASVPEVAGELSRIDLRAAPLTARGITALSRLPALREVDLTGCVFAPSDWSALGNATQIEVLNLNSAAVGDTTLGFLEQLVNLRHLNLQSTNLTDIPFVHLKNLSRLEELHVDGILSFTGKGLEALGPQGARAPLRVLTATNTKLGVFGFESIGSFRDLEVLAAGSAGVADIHLTALRGLSQLRVLQLQGNSLSDQGLRILSGMKQLEQLNLSGNPLVTNDTLQRIQNHKQLRGLSIEGTSCNAAGVQTLSQKLPDCEIQFGGTTF